MLAVMVCTALANRLIRIGTVGEFQVNYVWADFAGGCNARRPAKSSSAAMKRLSKPRVSGMSAAMRPADPCGPTGRSRCCSDARRIPYSFANEKVEALRVVVNDDGLLLRGAKHDLGLLNVGLTRTIRAATGEGEVNPGNRAHAPKPRNHDRRSSLRGKLDREAATARHDR
jgi:hypothetical protein